MIEYKPEDVKITWKGLELKGSGASEVFTVTIERDSDNLKIKEESYKEDLTEFVRLITKVEHLMSGDQLSATVKIIVNYKNLLERLSE